MKYFLIGGAVHAYESDSSQDHLIPAGAQQITEAQAIEIANPPPTLDDRREAVWEAVKSKRKRHTDGGVLVRGHWFHSDTESKIQHLELRNDAQKVLVDGGGDDDVLTIASQPIIWKTLTNDLVPMTVGLAKEIVDAIKVLEASAFARAETLRALIEASEDPESIDIGSGWPAIYEDTL